MPVTTPLDGMYLPVDKAETVLRMILEGNSVSSVERITEVHKATILKLLVEVGTFCAGFQNYMLRNLPCQKVQAQPRSSVAVTGPKRASRRGRANPRHPSSSPRGPKGSARA